MSDAPLKWQGTPLPDLADDAVKEAYITLAEMDNFRLDRMADPRFKKKFLNQLDPVINQAYTDMQIMLNNELIKRNLEF